MCPDNIYDGSLAVAKNIYGSLNKGSMVGNGTDDT
jgi:hypothetical protein